MTKLCKVFPLTIPIILAASANWAIGGQRAEASERARVVVTLRKTGQYAPPRLTSQDVLVYQNNERRPVLGWAPARGEQAGLDLAILIDDSLASSLGLQRTDLNQFIASLPSTTRVAVAYGDHGDADTKQTFTSDHELAAKSLRLPEGRINEGSSIYLSLTDLMKHRPEGDNRRAILLVSDGIDLFRGVVDSEPTLNPELNQAIEMAHRKDIMVYTIFADGAASFTRNFFLINNGQGCLARLAYETGGESYFQGFQTPLAFAPYLKKLGDLLEHQYLLTFQARLGKEPAYERLRVTTEQPGVELIGPDQVFIPGAGS